MSSLFSPDRQLRLECLRLATMAPGGDALHTAWSFYAFAVDAEERPPREKILAALEAAGVS